MIAGGARARRARARRHQGRALEEPRHPEPDQSREGDGRGLRSLQAPARRSPALRGKTVAEVLGLDAGGRESSATSAAGARRDAPPSRGSAGEEQSAWRHALITQRRSSAGANPAQRETLRTLGLRGIGTTTERAGRARAAGHDPARRASGRGRAATEGLRWLTTRHRACTRSRRRAARASARKRIGRGEGSGYGKTSGRGQKGAGSRSGNKRKAGYEGGQNPLHMRMRKLRGPHMKKSMPFEPFRTHTQPVNLADLNRFEDGAEVTPETLRAARPRDAQAGTRSRSSRAASSSARTWSCRHTASAPRRARRSRARAGPARSSRRGRARGRRAEHDRHHRQRLQRPGDPPEDPLHVPDPGALPARRRTSRCPASTSTRSRTSATASAARTSSAS